MSQEIKYRLYEGNRVGRYVPVDTDRLLRPCSIIRGSYMVLVECLDDEYALMQIKSSLQETDDPRRFCLGEEYVIEEWDNIRTVEMSLSEYGRRMSLLGLKAIEIIKSR